ncbi:MAG: sigma 54-interacting transcriptional regulator [Pseudomonadota bacterium]
MSTGDASREGAGAGALIIEREGKPELRVALTGHGIRLGSHPRNDVSLPGSGLPDFFAEIVAAPQGGHAVLASRGQQLEINDKKASRHTLHEGDRIALGRFRGRYCAPQAHSGSVALGSTGQITLNRDASTLSVAEGMILVDEGETTRRIGVGVGGVRIGKAADNDLVIGDSSVSGYHAVVFARGDRYFIQDLESTNGTVVGNLKVVESELPFGVEFRLGRVRLHFDKHITEAALLPSERTEFEGILSGDPNMRRVFSLIERIAGHDATVCINGESGTGKELVAQALHRLSPRCRGPMVALNVSALPRDLIESELFGHEKGAFSGADRARPGAFEQAQKGTLFLDEIGELPLEVQPKLLRVLETRQARRVGGRESMDLDVRILCATHRNLAAMVRQGTFREDLLHRVFVLPIQLPPLRDRRGDVELLARHFLRTLDPAGAHQLSEDALQLLRSYSWPGNVRELRNVLLRAVMLSEKPVLDEDSIVFVGDSLEGRLAEGQAYMPLLRLQDLERMAIQQALERSAGKRSAAAELLGINRSTLLRKLKELKLEEPTG